MSLNPPPFIDTLALVQELLADTRQMQQQLAGQTTESVLTAAVLQRWLARTERIRQLQEWLTHQPLAELPLDQRQQLEEAIAALCRAMVPIGPIFQRHQQSVVDALTRVGQRRQQLNRYHQTQDELDADCLVTDRA